MLSLGSMLNNRYEILEKVGSGGMSVVYKAKDIKLGRFVAIKVLREEFCFDENFVKKFKVEAQSAASLSHSNIVNIYDVGNEGRTHFIVMEYLEGETLKDYIKNNGQLPENEILKIAVCIASALDHAHNNHIIHRDIKPQNIMLTNDGKVKVADFGIARVASENTIDMPENPTGSVYYIAPEQARGGYQDNKSDIYSLGITMYEMATGVLPFTGENAVTVALKQIHDDLPLPSEINKHLSKNIETIILKATQKKTTQRYQSAMDILDDLKLSMNNPEDVLIYTLDTAPDETMMMSHEEMKHIWSKSEVLAYSGKKDPLDIVVTIAGVILALTLVGLVAVFVYNGFAKEFIPINITVPNIVGTKVLDASASLDTISLNINQVGEQFNEEFEEGYIISQDPSAGSIVLENEIIKVIISKGIELVMVTNVINTNYEDAESNLKDQGFNVTVIAQYNDITPIGAVIRQDPMPSQKVSKDAKVILFVSKGPEDIKIEVPDLRDIEVFEATMLLESLNLQIGNITEIYHDEIAEGYIISTTVEPGREVKEGYIIDIAVSLGPEIVEVTKVYIVNNILDHEQSECELKVILKLNGVEQIIYNETVDASVFPLSLSATGVGEGTIHVYNDEVQEYEFFVQFTDISGGQ